ncbi:hypothetical protein Mapa_017006 [Marchantia paleacea]|nr:hypothetical protein Mapa_017006 [Marchantia paleacea]
MVGLARIVNHIWLVIESRRQTKRRLFSSFAVSSNPSFRNPRRFIHTKTAQAQPKETECGVSLGWSERRALRLGIPGYLCTIEMHMALSTEFPIAVSTMISGSVGNGPRYVWLPVIARS